MASAEEQPPQQQQRPPGLTPVAKPLSLIPVVLKEAGLDSPTFRATAIHFGEQLDLIEKWLENYLKSASKLAQEVTALESLVNGFVNSVAPPPQVSEAVLDHDYTILALKRYSEGVREFWTYTLRGMKKVEGSLVEPIKSFLHNDLRQLKEARKTLDHSQKYYDSLIARYSGQAKTKEASALREDAFQLHESRKAYLRASMDFCTMAPQVRTTLDKLLVKVLSEQWREMKSSRDLSSSAFTKYGPEMDRVRGWSREMENGERVFKRELQLARKQIEDNAEYAFRPSRELDDYATSTVPYLGSQAHSTGNLLSPAKPVTERPEMQGWLFQRTVTGKPARTIWVRRWYFVKNGIFGWLANNPRSGAVEESEKIGVLLCSIRPAYQEERRFCFEVKTKDTTIILQAERQKELMEWIGAFDVAKRKALEDPASTENMGPSTIDAAFAISPPVAPEFAARTGDGHISHLSEEIAPVDRSETLPVPGADGLGSLATRSSFDVTSKRGFSGDREGESSRDHAARIIQKLDLHRKSTAGPQLSSNPSPAPSSGIASLISASLISAGTSIMPMGPVVPSAPADGRITPNTNIPTSTLAPSTLANPPAPTNLSKTAVVVSGERGVGMGRSDGGMPSGIMANLWGSTNWGYINRLERGELKPPAQHHERSLSQPPSPIIDPELAEAAKGIPDTLVLPGNSTSGPAVHRKTMSLEAPTRLQRPTIVTEDFPNYYPLPLRAQDAQFRILFPNVPRSEKVILVFRAVWNPTEQQEFPGRVYVTEKDLYFYSNHLGLVLITSLSLSSIDEVTAAPGRDCDFLYLHFKEGVRQDGSTRVTVKTFLEPLKLLQRRLNFLVRNADSDDPLPIEDVLKALIKMEIDDAVVSPSLDSWEEVSSHTPVDGAPGRSDKDVRARLRIDGNLYAQNGTGLSRSATKFKLPPQPVKYAPQGMAEVPVELEFDISAKALFHVMFGDKSAVFQLLYKERWARRVVQGPWVQPEQGLRRRDFTYEVDLPNGSSQTITDYQAVEVHNDHLCYVILDKKTPWYLPYSNDFQLVTKFVITHVAKSRCKLAIYTKIEWSKDPLLKKLIQRQALIDLSLDALDLADVISAQVAKLGASASSSSGTRKALQIFGALGQQTTAAQFEPSDIPPLAKERRFKLKRRSITHMLMNLVRINISVGFWMVVSAVGSLLGALVKVCTAHTLLIALLIASALFNGWYTSRDAMQWWTDRSAASFMSRVGVKPDLVMARAIQLKDIEEAIAPLNETVWDGGHGGGNRCLQTFTDLLQHSEEPAAAVSSSASINPSYHAITSTRNTASRLARSRLSLQTYRHDLLIALRVVNNVEREVLRAEYENWLLDEGNWCRRVKGVIGPASEGDGEGSKGGDSDSAGVGEEVRDWVEDYCGACEGELRRVVGAEGLGGGGSGV